MRWMANVLAEEDPDDSVEVDLRVEGKNGVTGYVVSVEARSEDAAADRIFLAFPPKGAVIDDLQPAVTVVQQPDPGLREGYREVRVLGLPIQRPESLDLFMFDGRA